MRLFGPLSREMCVVKTGAYEDLKPRCLFLLEEGLSAEIV